MRNPILVGVVEAGTALEIFGDLWGEKSEIRNSKFEIFSELSSVGGSTWA